MNDFIDFATKNFKVINHDKLVSFQAYKLNIDLTTLFENEQFILVKKCRQAGFSLFCMLWALYECMYKDNQHIMLIYKTDGEIVRYISQEFNQVIVNMPDDVRPKFDKFDAHTVRLKNGNDIIFTTQNAVIGGGFCNVAIFDEAALWSVDLETFCKVFMGGKLIIGSTPNGKDNYFYKLWTEENKFYKYAFMWYDHPDYTPEKCAEYHRVPGEKGWRQEALGEFVEE